MMSLCVLLALTSLVARADGDRDAATYMSQPAYTSGWANIDSPNGGRYVYSQSQKSDGRETHGSRFMLGKPQREQYDLFSSQEEETLWNYRQQKIVERDALVAKVEMELNPPHVVARRRGVKLVLDWPKVVVDGTKTCVPAIEFSNAPDWKEHLTCWSSESRNVK